MASIFQEILDLVWPVLLQILEKMDWKEITFNLSIYLIGIFALFFFLKKQRSEKTVGNFFSEVYHLIVSLGIYLLPLVIVIKVAGDKYPILFEAISFAFEKSDLKETIFYWFRVFLLMVVIYGLQRMLIHWIVLKIEKAVFNLWEPLVVFVVVAEAVMFMGTSVFLPLNIIVFANQMENRSIVQSDATTRPVGVSEDLYSLLKIGVGKAQANGVACELPLLVSLKEYETSTVICSPEDEARARPNSCASYADALGTFQFLQETFDRNAVRYGVTGSLWETEVAAEVACYFIAEEVNLSLDQTEDEFADEFYSKGFIWNADPSGAREVYRRAIELRNSSRQLIAEAQKSSVDDQSQSAPPLELKSDGYIWPAPAGSFVTFEWGVPMWYGGTHNGMDVAKQDPSGVFSTFQAYAIRDGRVRYWNGGDCNAGVITFEDAKTGEQFEYVHMELDPARLNIPTTGEWVSVQQGDILGWVLNSGTTCSDGPHLHIMRADGSAISQSEFQR